MNFKIPMATTQQIDYIAALFIDILGANNTRLERLSFMRLRTRNSINYADELTLSEANQLINQMKQIKEERNEQRTTRKVAHPKWRDSRPDEL